jgi:acyl-coenzyme A synthetase/AMP-(fatty) acid ligase
MVQSHAAFSPTTSRNMLHCDLRREDVLLLHHLRLDDVELAGLRPGRGGHPGAVRRQSVPPFPKALWQMAQDEKITVFGTSAGYLAALQAAGVRPREEFDLSALRAVLSTGSPLSIESFEFVYDAIKTDLQLASIAGGTDLNGCFALGNPMGPVYAGELQCRGLAMKVFAFDDDGNPVVGQEGELVCAAPFPSMPIYFWNDPDGAKYEVPISTSIRASGATVIISWSANTAGW